MITPRATLVLFILLAVAILAGGVEIARRQEVVRLDRDRQPMNRFSGEVQGELRRLESLYEDHLGRLALETDIGDPAAIRRAADEIVGVREFSVLRRDANTGADSHVAIGAESGGRPEVPMFDAARRKGLEVPVLVSRDAIFNDEGTRRGWIDEPGKPLMFWRAVDPGTAVVLTVDPPAVQTAVDKWLGAWAADRFDPVRSAGGPDEFRSGAGASLQVEGSVPDGRPDLLVPLGSRLGSWELASWDRRETRVRYDVVALMATAALAAFVALMGVLIFIQQRRAALLAAQRVSFVNRVSHELRTPLTNILLNVDLAADALDDAPEPSRRLALVTEEAHRLGRLIDNVLTFSRREQDQLRNDPRACIPANVIAGVTEQFAPSFHRRSLEVRRTGDLTQPCRMDADALAQIIGNLFSNVEKYVPGGIVEVHGEIIAGELVVTVTDQGPGIPAEAAERIFRPFERLGNRVNEGSSGTGLGLAIARDLARAMGGSLRLIPGVRGASFELRVPAPTVEPISTVAAA